MNYIFKLDLDIKLDNSEYELFKLTRIAIVEKLGFKVDTIIKHDSDIRGHHIWIHIISNRIIEDRELNFVQFLLGDDQTRYKINKERIHKGISWDKANILFSRVLERRHYDKRKP